MKLSCYALVLVSATGFGSAAGVAAPLNTAFTYQGRLTNGATTASGPYDFEFRLFDDVTAGVQVGSTLTVDDVTVTGGLFTVTLDFGSVYDGNRRWLSIAVRPGESVEPCTPLTPRQELTGTPHALFALNAQAADGLRLPFGASASAGIPIFSIHNTGTGLAISGTAVGTGVSGSSTAATGMTEGGLFRSSSTSGRGVFGIASATAGNTSGVYGQSDSATGRGVFGTATATTGAKNCGGWFQSGGTGGVGAFGWASSGSGTTYGLYGLSDSATGRGVHGWASSASGRNYGVYGQSDGNDGRGVYGIATATTGFTYGGKFENDSTQGGGVQGVAKPDSGETSGVFGQSNSTSGRGVYGIAAASTGQSYGGYFQSKSSEGTGVYASAETGRPAVVADHMLHVGSDTREGWLRVYGTASKESLVNIFADRDGGNVVVFESEGRPAAVLEASQDLSGGHLRVDRGSGNPGFVVQGNAGSQEPMVRITGSSRSAVFNMRTTIPDDETVILPEGAVCASEIGDEPGIAVGFDASHSLTESLTTLLSVDITTPAVGYVFAIATANARVEHGITGASSAEFGLTDGISPSYSAAAFVHAGLPAGPFLIPVTVQRVFPANAGLTTISIIGREILDGWTAQNIRLTLIYFPTAYGAAPASASASMPKTNAGQVVSASGQAATAAEAPASDRARMASELKEVKARLARLEAMLEQGSKGAGR
ncbi:MAG TPA: hypothetical protein PKY77_09605 [Phycisphaerae bacterium]|nr:hypothetical protein [Phycisphaerae bacterium]HRY68186.1 hypothetical protein [Phycisphaerae bacterium]HSA27084.1 hypothetical protein [Phycisphaerae bacterium]